MYLLLCYQNERSWENVHVLVPHIAALFKLLIAKANIPRTWKEATLTSIHKKGPVTQPRNKMIAISGTLHRLHTNSRLSDSGLVHPTQQDYGHAIRFYPGKSTLQPLFIPRHVKHAAQRMQSGSSRLYAAFIDFKQAYDCIPRHKLKSIYAVA